MTSNGSGIPTDINSILTILLNVEDPHCGFTHKRIVGFIKKQTNKHTKTQVKKNDISHHRENGTFSVCGREICIIENPRLIVLREGNRDEEHILEKSGIETVSEFQ